MPSIGIDIFSNRLDLSASSYKYNPFTGFPNTARTSCKIDLFTGLLVLEGYLSPPVLTYNDAALSGAPKLMRLSNAGVAYYVKAYPTIGAEVGGSGDYAAEEVYLINDTALSGTPVVFAWLSGGTDYYWKGYPTVAAATYHGGHITQCPQVYADAKLSGTPRIAKAIVGGTAYYWKVYPTKA